MRGLRGYLVDHRPFTSQRYLVSRRLVRFPARETLQRWLHQAGVEKVVEIWNQISPELAVSRYATRLQDRRAGHPGEEYLPELALLAERAEPMRLGPVFTVDQQQPLDIIRLSEWIKQTLG
jgi:hypothetical protein